MREDVQITNSCLLQAFLFVVFGVFYFVFLLAFFISNINLALDFLFQKGSEEGLIIIIKLSLMIIVKTKNVQFA